MTPIFEVLEAGFLASFQNTGRVGQQRFGLSEGGAMDEVSFRWGQALLQNSPQTLSLEIAYGPLRLTALQTTHITVTGADLHFTLNGQKAPRFQVLSIQPGDQLHWSHPVEGTFAYLNVSQGFHAPSHLGCASVHVREGWGAPIVQGQTLFQNAGLSKGSDAKHLQNKPIPQSLWRKNNAPLTLRVIPGGQFEHFSKEARERFFQQSYELTNDINRTGYRLLSAEKVPPPFSKMLSEGVPLGTIQIPPSGQPIIMMREHPTIGGYPKIGTVFSVDLSYLAQTPPHQTVQFRAITQRQAQRLRQQFESLWP